MIFLDLANAEYGLEEHEGLENCRIDYLDLATTLIDERKIIRATAYDTHFFFKNHPNITDHLSESGFRLQKGHLIDGKQKEVDVSIAVDMLTHAIADNYDVAILISGDRDFIPAIHAVQNLGKRVEVAAFRDTVSDVTTQVADRYTDLSMIPMVDYYPPYIHSESEFEEFMPVSEFSGDPEFETLENIINEEYNNLEVTE